VKALAVHRPASDRDILEAPDNRGATSFQLLKARECKCE
jgi:hypothetical protein